MKLWLPIAVAVLVGALFVACSGSTGMQLTPPVTTSVSSLFDNTTPTPSVSTPSLPFDDSGILDPTPGILETQPPSPTPSPTTSPTPDTGDDACILDGTCL